MMKAKGPAPAKAGSKVKRGPGKRPAGTLAPVTENLSPTRWV